MFNTIYSRNGLTDQGLAVRLHSEKDFSYTAVSYALINPPGS